MTCIIKNILLIVLISLTSTQIYGQAAFLTSSGYGYSNYPWGSLDYPTCMDNVFGVNNWDNLNFATVNANNLFSNAYTVIYLEGSDFAALDFAAFVTANQALMEAWVTAGGLLYINAAPNVGGNISIGFGGVEILYEGGYGYYPPYPYPPYPPYPYYPNYPYYPTTFTDCVDIAPGIEGNCLITDSPVDIASAFPICGNFFGHAFISGPGIIPILENDVTGDPVLAEFPFGAGNVVVGGITSPLFHEPLFEAKQLLENTITNVACNSNDCADAIEGQVVAPFECDLSGVTVVISIINADGSETIVGNTTTDAAGNYMVPNSPNNVWVCGNYSAMLMLPLPDCYADAAGNSGPTGPITFTVDGDGNPDGAAFILNAEIPTLSQWGLIVLALLLMNSGAIFLLKEDKLFNKKLA